jgi:rubrerythrin
MSNVKDEFISTAIEFERQGFDFYTGAAARASSDLARGVFESLAQDELRHIAWIKALSAGAATAHSENQALADRLRPIFKGVSEQVQAAAASSSDDIAALNLGIEREDMAVRAYTEAAAGADSDEFRRLCEVLVDVEKTHRQLLENVVSYLESPDQFFLGEERWIVEG